MPEAAALGLRLIELLLFGSLKKDRRGTILLMVFLWFTAIEF